MSRALAPMARATSIPRVMGPSYVSASREAETLAGGLYGGALAGGLAGLALGTAGGEIAGGTLGGAIAGAAAGGLVGLGIGVTALIVLEAMQALAGRPKELDTAQAAFRLSASPNPAVKTLAAQFAFLARNNVPLSDSNPAVQKLIGGLFHNAVLGLEENLGWSQQQAFWHLENVISSHTARSGITIPAPSQGANSLTASKPLSVAQNATGSAASSRLMAARSSSLNWFQRTTPLALIPSPPPLATQVEIVENPAGYVFSQIGGAMNGLGNFVNGFFANQTGGARTPAVNPQSGYPAPTPSNQLGAQLGQHGSNPNLPPAPQPVYELEPCKECGYQPSAQQDNVLASQRGQLEQEVRTEQNQQLVERIQRQQQEIDRLRGLENQPASQRDIPRELQEKQSLLRDIDSERHGHYPAPSGGNGYSQPITQSGQPAPELDMRGTSSQYELEPVQETFIQGQSDNLPAPHDSNQVKFCVVCSSVNESHKFLNGEPSECSVLTQ